MGQAKRDRATEWAKNHNVCPNCGGDNHTASEDGSKLKCCWCKTEFLRKDAQ